MPLALVGSWGDGMGTSGLGSALVSSQRPADDDGPAIRGQIAARCDKLRHHRVWDPPRVDPCTDTVYYPQ